MSSAYRPSQTTRRLRNLIFVLAVAGYPAPSFAATCPVIPARTSSPAEQASREGKLDNAATLYQEQLAQHPNDPALTAGFVRVLLRQQKTKEAEDLAQKALAVQPRSAILTAALGEVQYREGELWLAGSTALNAEKIDPCEPRAHLLAAQYLTATSMYGKAADEVATAYHLDPSDAEIHIRWLETLPLNQRKADLEAYLSAPAGRDPDELMNLHLYLGQLRKETSQSRHGCTLSSAADATSVPFALIMHDSNPLRSSTTRGLPNRPREHWNINDSNRLRAYGLDVKLNDHSARLQVAVDAAGITVSSAMAKRAGLQRIADAADPQRTYAAYADDLRIGALEFHDCEVTVLDHGFDDEVDGRIGMDVFSPFLITIDYPMRNLALGPLPRRPNDPQPVKPSLNTAATIASPRPDPISETARDRYIAPEMKDWAHVYRVGHSLLIPASLNNSSLKLFALDTGAFSTTTVAPSVAREVTSIHLNENLPLPGVNRKVTPVYTADQIVFKFANLTQKVEDVIAYDNPHAGKNVGLQVDGLIGLTALGATTTTIDYRDGLVKFDYDPKRNLKIKPAP